jgi:cold shock CspA family protein
MDAVSELQTGTICTWLEPRGFGFISRGSGKTFERFFFHAKQFKSAGPPIVGSHVTFTVKPVQDGPCPTAEQVTVIS